jgi:galactokinase
MTLQQHLTATFQQHFGEAPTYIIRAPGRVNLIGEHTDYNDGFVLPMAINRAAWIALRPRTDQRVIVHSLEFNDSTKFDLTDLQKGAGWSEYLKGTAWALRESGYTLHGWEGVVAGDVPIGAGLSSSAALELATARTFAAISNFAWDAATMAKVCQRAENEWVGMNCGIMDQMISAAGKADHALLIDCRSLDTDLVPLPPGTVIVILDTSTRRGLVDSAYNERREQCEAVAKFFNVPALRDVNLEQFEAQADQLDDLIMRRARHVITENDRTVQAKNAMVQGDAAELGRLMDASHVSMRDDFEISSDALNAIVVAAQQHTACFGARMTGGGFAGCAVALVQTDAAQDFATSVAASYEQSTGLTPNIYICTATNGAEVISGV